MCVCVCMCLVGRGWEGNVTVTGKQPTCLSSTPETNLPQWDKGLQCYMEQLGSTHTLKKSSDRVNICARRWTWHAAWRMRRKELVLSVSGVMGTAIQTSSLGSSKGRELSSVWAKEQQCSQHHELFPPCLYFHHCWSWPSWERPSVLC